MPIGGCESAAHTWASPASRDRSIRECPTKEKPETVGEIRENEELRAGAKFAGRIKGDNVIADPTTSGWSVSVASAFCHRKNGRIVADSDHSVVPSRRTRDLRRATR